MALSEIKTNIPKVKVKSLSRVRLFVTPWTVAYQAPPSMRFSRQEYWSGCHFLLQGIVLTQGSNPNLLHFRQILYHLSHQRSAPPAKKKTIKKLLRLLYSVIY